MTEAALFDAEPYTVPTAIMEPGETLSADRRRTLRQARDLTAGRHPLTGGRLHPDAAPADDRRAEGARCGTCRFRAVIGYHNRSYGKCLWPNPDAAKLHDLPRVTHGAATDCRGWWPACTDWQPQETASVVSAQGGST